MKKKWTSILMIIILTIISFSNFGITFVKAETQETANTVKSKEEEELSLKFINTQYIHASDGSIWTTEGEKVLEHIQEVKVTYEKGDQEDYAYYLTKFGELYFTGYTSHRRIGNNAKNKPENAFSTHGFQEDAACLLVKNVREFGEGYAIQNDGTLYVWGSIESYKSPEYSDYCRL